LEKKMKRKLLILSSALALLMPAVLFAADPEFGPWQYVNANGAPITLSLGHANPCMVDWDGDNLKDLLVGQYTGGKMRFYPNSGSNISPVFTTFSYMQSDGIDISLPYG
jgi:hypothetical protein